MRVGRHISVLGGLALAALLCVAPAAVRAQGGWTEAKPVLPPEPPPDEAPATDADAAHDGAGGEEAGPGDAGDGQEEPGPAEELRRARPQTTAEELVWIERNIQDDPFMRPFAIGPAPETMDFYDPFARLHAAGMQIAPQASRYLVQSANGTVLGQLTLRITAEQSPLYGPTFHIAQVASIGTGEQVDVWMSSVSNKPLRVLRQRDFGGGRPDEHGVVVRDIERFDAKYQFDRATVIKTRGGVTLAAPTRLQYSCFDVAQLPLLMQLLDYNASDWPFEALLFDTTSLEMLPLQVNRPSRTDVLSAEPETCACWQIPVRWRDQKLNWYIERQGQRRLVKFEFSGMVFTLQDFVLLPARG
jgi:hypothetical protein